MSALLSEEVLPRQLQAVPEWKKEGKAIVRVFAYPTFLEGIDFVREVAALAEEANHHPDIDIRWRKITLLLTSHDAGGLTEKDFQLASAIDKIHARSK